MEGLDIKLKIFQIYTHAENPLFVDKYWIASKTKEDAINYFMHELNTRHQLERALDVVEIKKDTDLKVCVMDEDLLLELMNKHRKKGDKVDSLNIWDYLIYLIVEKSLQGKGVDIPFVICSITTQSIFSSY